MTAPRMEDLYPASPAYLSLQPLRIPAGWVIGWNTLSTDLADPGAAPGGSSLFNATNAGRRFNIDVEYRPEFDPAGAFHLTVLYQPWLRTERGRRLTSAPFALTGEAETVHGFETRAYPALVQALEHWIARCSVWEREGG